MFLQLSAHCKKKQEKKTANTNYTYFDCVVGKETSKSVRWLFIYDPHTKRRQHLSDDETAHVLKGLNHE